MTDQPKHVASAPDPTDVDQVRELLDLMVNFPDNDQRARYLLSSNWAREKIAQDRFDTVLVKRSDLVQCFDRDACDLIDAVGALNRLRAVAAIRG